MFRTLARQRLANRLVEASVPLELALVVADAALPERGEGWSSFRALQVTDPEGARALAERYLAEGRREPEWLLRGLYGEEHRHAAALLDEARAIAVDFGSQLRIRDY